MRKQHTENGITIFFVVPFYLFYILKPYIFKV